MYIYICVYVYVCIYSDQSWHISRIPGSAAQHTPCTFGRHTCVHAQMHFFVHKYIRTHIHTYTCIYTKVTDYCLSVNPAEADLQCFLHPPADSMFKTMYSYGLKVRPPPSPSASLSCVPVLDPALHATLILEYTHTHYSVRQYLQIILRPTQEYSFPRVCSHNMHVHMRVHICILTTYVSRALSPYRVAPRIKSTL
jgi:hypothetical protein